MSNKRENGNRKQSHMFDAIIGEVVNLNQHQDGYGAFSLHWDEGWPPCFWKKSLVKLQKMRLLKFAWCGVDQAIVITLLCLALKRNRSSLNHILPMQAPSSLVPHVSIACGISLAWVSFGDHLEQLHPYSAFGPAKVFLPYKITYLSIPSRTHKHEPRTIKDENWLITNHPSQSIYFEQSRAGVRLCYGFYAQYAEAGKRDSIVYTVIYPMQIKWST
jgi:hypothetical protein